MIADIGVDRAPIGGGWTAYSLVVKVTDAELVSAPSLFRLRCRITWWLLRLLWSSRSFK